MRLLLDTHVLIWAMVDPRRLPKPLAAALRSPDNDVAVSATTVWEIAIKKRLGNLDLDLEELLGVIAEEGFSELPVRFSHAVHVNELPPIHRDPFDRILIAQSIVEGRRLVTTDREILKYIVPGFNPLTA